jgi:hypothetical protein
MERTILLGEFRSAGGMAINVERPPPRKAAKQLPPCRVSLVEARKDPAHWQINQPGKEGVMDNSSQEKQAHTAGESVLQSDDGSREDGEASSGSTVIPQTVTGPGKGGDGDDEQ